MDDRNYVAPSGNGYVVVVNGQIVGNYASQSEAENAYNNAGGSSGNGGGGSSQPANDGRYTDANGITIIPTVPPTYIVPGYGTTWDYGVALQQAALAGLGGSSGGAPSGGSGTTGGTGGTYTTRDGAMSYQQLESALRAAGYGGPWDANSMVAAYNRADPTYQQGAGDYDWDALWSALMGSEGDRFAWTKEIALKQLEEEVKNREEQARQFNANLYSGLAQALLGGATSLAGTPQDWVQYANYTHGGKNIFDTLYGSTPAPAFSAPTGISQPRTIQDVLADLGLIAPTAAGQAVTTPGLVTQPNYDTMEAPGVADMSRAMAMATAPAKSNNPADWTEQAVTGPTTTPNYGTMATPTQPAGAVTTPGLVSPPTYETMATPKSGASWLGSATGEQAAPGQVVTPGLVTQPNYGTMAVTGAQPGVAQQGMPDTRALAPLPHQINPAVWDSMSSTAQQLVLGAAQAGKTPSGVWTAEDYLRQLNAARPKGTAPQSVQFNWGNNQSLF